MDATSRGTALLEILLRSFALLVYGTLVAIIARHWWADTGRHTLLLLLISEGLTVALVLFARHAVLRDASPLAIIATSLALSFFLFFEYSGTVGIIPEQAGVALQIGGIA